MNRSDTGCSREVYIGSRNRAFSTWQRIQTHPLRNSHGPEGLVKLRSQECPYNTCTSHHCRTSVCSLHTTIVHSTPNISADSRLVRFDVNNRSIIIRYRMLRRGVTRKKDCGGVSRLPAYLTRLHAQHHPEKIIIF